MLTDTIDILLTGSAVQYCPALLKEGVWDTRERLTDYLCAIRCWLAHPNVRSVVYCDAGNFLMPQQVIGEERFEPLAVDLIDFCIQKGRGAAECESIRYAMATSRLLGSRFFKCTGRLYVTNFERIVRATRPEGRFLYLNKSDEMQGSDTRFYGIDREYFLTAAMPLVSEMHDYTNEIIEKVFYHRIHQYCMFPPPFIMGRSGYAGHPYNASYSERQRNEARELLKNVPIPKNGL